MECKVRGTRFTLQRIFIATFWLALSCGAWTQQWGVEEHNNSFLMPFATAALGLIGPFVAIGALFRRAWIVGILGIIVLGGYVYLEINRGTGSFP
jgi:hypothetical protein